MVSFSTGFLRFTFVSLAVLLLAAPSALAKKTAFAKKKKDEPRTTVADLRYGVALYHYYQEAYLDALTELMVAKERGGIQGHGDNPEIMEGGFALAYGLEKHAGDIFDRLLENNRSEEARDAAWFFIARLRYYQEDFAGVDEAFSHISDEPKEKIRNELTVLRIHQAIKQNRLDEAEELMRDEEIDEAWVPYVVFNMASALAREERYEEALDYYKYFKEEDFIKKEHIALFDKAMTATGYAYLFNKQPEKAIEHFSYVRRDSKHATRALLGYGWAAADQEDYKTALKPWSFLARSSLVDENSLESLVAVPYAYEKLGAENLALENFKIAEARFVEEVFVLEEVIANIEGDSILEALQIEESEGLNWLRYAEENQLAPQLSYLIKLFSQERFQSSIQELRDLLATQTMLYDWREKLGFYLDMLDEREFSRVTKNEYLAETALKEKISEMEDLRAATAEKIDSITREKDYFSLLSEEQQDLYDRVQRSETSIEALRASDPFIDEYEESIRRYKGLLMWDAAEAYSVRLWRIVKNLEQLDATIGELRRNHQSVINILNDAPDMNGYRRRIAEANTKLDQQILATDNAVEKAKTDLRNQVAGVLVAQRNRLNHYLSQSRLSIARIYDKARVEHLQKQAEALQAEQEAAQAAEQAANQNTEAESEAGEATNTDSSVSEQNPQEQAPAENNNASETQTEAEE